MPRVETARSKVQKLLRAVPFRPFALVLENGQRIVVDHPETIAFRPESKKRRGSETFYVYTDGLELHSNFGVVTSIALIDEGESELAG